MEWRIGRWRNPNLVTCSLCLRVHRGSAWVEPESIITELRSYELDTAPTLLPGVCDACTDAILGRRVQPEETLAA
jgi:hypothetical protein